MSEKLTERCNAQVSHGNDAAIGDLGIRNGSTVMAFSPVNNHGRSSLVELFSR
jgi:hypothetical protein